MRTKLTVALTLTAAATALLAAAPAAATQHDPSVIFRAPYGSMDRIKTIPQPLTLTDEYTPAPMPTRHFYPAWPPTGSAG